MRLTRRELLGAAAALPVLGVATAPAFAMGTTVEVSLWDQGADKAMPTNMGYGMSGDASKATMGIAVSTDTVKAGEVAFQVSNASKDTIHEMIVVPLKHGEKTLPYNKDENRVNEDEAGDLGEVSELDPGAHGTLVIPMKPGKYLLYCNVPGHFAAGMWTLFTVKA